MCLLRAWQSSSIEKAVFVLRCCLLLQDFCKLTGISAPKQRMPMLEQLLSDTRSTLDQVMDFMLGKL